MARHGVSRSSVRLAALLVPALSLVTYGAVSGLVTADGAPRAKAGRNPGSYSNPLRPTIPGDGVVESCADPTVIHGQVPGDTTWYMYCTTDPLNDEDLDADGDLVFHRVPTMTSRDLVHWSYVGDAFGSLPAWADPTAALWAPEITYSTTYDQYYMFVVVTDTTAAGGGSADPACHGDNAIGVATSDRPTGPWSFSDQPVIRPRPGPGVCDYKWTYDPDVLGDSVAASSTFYFGSYYGGVWGTDLTLTEDGAVTDQAGATQVAIDNKYEGADVVFRDGYYYLFLSSTNCCNGALTGYSVFVGRSRSPRGPFADREGNSLLDVQAGGTPVISMNGNRWVGTGHNTVFRDAAGRWWTIYHAVDQADPFFETVPGFTKRPPLLDALDWIDGWPTVNGGQWASDRKMPAPAAQPGQVSRHRLSAVRQQRPGRLLLADEFDGSQLDPAWSWVRPGAEYDVGGGMLTVHVQQPHTVPAPTPEDPDATGLEATDLNSGNNTASVLVRDAPKQDYIVETAVRLNVPDSPECCYNYAQGGVLVYENDDSFVKLTDTSIWNTRQTEWAKEIPPPVPAGWNRYGNTVVGPPSDSGEWTYLRIAVARLSGAQRRAAGGDPFGYTAYTSQDGRTWVRGGTWTHALTDADIGLVAMGLKPGEHTPGDYTVDYDYVRVYRLTHTRSR